MHSAAITSSPAPSPSRHWVDDAVDDLERLEAEAAPGLKRRLSRALRLLAGMNGGAGLADALRRPGSTPFVPVIDACAADLGLEGDERVALVGRSTVFLYAYVRVQDDLVDEPRRVDRASVYAAEALLAEHLRLLAEAVPDPRAFALRGTLMHRFSEVAADEVDWRRGAPMRPTLDWLGDKFLPMAVPLAALAVAAGEPHRADRLAAWVRALGCALQLVNDVLNVEEDRARGRITPVLSWLGEAGAVTPLAPLRAVLVGHPAMARAQAEARRFLDQARDIALEDDLPRLAAITGRARERVDRAPADLFRLLVGASI
jgi:hypothetical protein